MTEDEYRQVKADLLQWVEYGIIIVLVFGLIYVIKH